MVVEDDRLVTVVDALHILEGFVVCDAPVHVLHHVQVGGDTLCVGVFFQQIICEIVKKYNYHKFQRNYKRNYKRTPACTFSFDFVMSFKK